MENRDNIFYGRLPGFGLSRNGQEQAQRVAQVLARFRLAAVYTSPLERALQTALAILEYHKASEFIADESLLEVRSPFDGQPMPPIAASDFDLYTGVGQESEQPGDVLTRGLEFVRTACLRHAGKHLVAVTHGDVIAFMFLWASGVELKSYIRPSSRTPLNQFGLPDPYPEPCSVLTLEIHESLSKPSRIGYLNPNAASAQRDLFACSLLPNASLVTQPGKGR